MKSLILKSLEKRVNSSTLASLGSDGFAIIDNAVDSLKASDLFCEIQVLNQYNVLYPCHTHIVGNFDHQTQDSTLIAKENVFEFELHSFLSQYPELEQICPDLSNLLKDKSLCNILNSETNLFSKQKYQFTHQTLKLLYSFNNGCFPTHFDTDLTVDSRRITGILYLNPHYRNIVKSRQKDQDSSGKTDTSDARDISSNDKYNESNIDLGGQLRLYPLINSPPIDIEPFFNRLVLFSSPFMLHRTLPMNYGAIGRDRSQRYAINMWLHTDDKVESNYNMESGKDDINENGLLTQKYLKYICKYLYFDEWRQSIIDSHDCKEQGNKEKIEQLLNSHDNDKLTCEKVLTSKHLELLQYELENDTNCLSHRDWYAEVSNDAPLWF